MRETTPAPLTAGEAADLLIKNIDARPAAFYRDVVRGFMAQHWPAGGAVTALTGQAMYEAHGWTFHAGYVEEWGSLERHTQENWNRAAARLAAPVAFDVEAVADEIACSLYSRTVIMHDEVREKAEEILRRHAAAPATATPLTYDLAIAAAYRHVVDMIDASTDTEPDVALSRLRHYFDLLADTHREGAAAPVTGVVEQSATFGVVRDYAPEPTADAVAKLKAMYDNARAGTAGQTTGAQWVRRPEGQASSLVVPETGAYVIEYGDTEPSIASLKRGTDLGVLWPQATRIRRIDTDAPTTWIDRTPATAGGWTADVIPSAPFVAYGADGLRELFEHDPLRREKVAQWLNDQEVTHLAIIPILPPVEAQP